jgi:hypothetical protein
MSNEHLNALAAAFDDATKRSPSGSSVLTAKSVSGVPAHRRAMWNIGLDFGTAFTKCIARNLATNEAFVVPIGGTQHLLPSEIIVGQSGICLAAETINDTQLSKFHNLKMALAETASGQTDGAWAANLRHAAEGYPTSTLARKPGDLAAYFLARVIQRARAFILSKSAGFDESRGDRCFLNMAVPVAHAQDTRVAAEFDTSLRKAWLLARETTLGDWPQTQVAEALSRVDTSPGQDIGCYIYPEVSANVQSYIKSRAGSDGLYLFVDVGAGTVDLSVFIYYTHPTNDRPISYVAAGVIPLGSSQIEIRAACRVADRTLSVLKAAGIPLGNDGLLQTKLQEIIRLGKEGQRIEQVLFQEMQAAQKSVENDLYHREAPIIESARRKFRQGSRTSAQWGTLKLLIGGGGASAPLYQSAINQWFKQVSHFEPPRKQIPLPQDLKWPADLPPASHANAFRRFAVAYGLSFDRANLEDHRFPKDVRPIPQRPSSPPVRHHAPTKEEC